MSLNVPNILTLFRLFAAPFVAWLLISDLDRFGQVLALVVFLVAAITDYLDGYLARLLNQSTTLGKILDPIADKAMVILTLSFLSYSFDDYWNQLSYGVPAILIIFREIFVSSLREYIGKDSKLLTVTTLSKWKTSLQLFAIGVLLLGRIDGTRIFSITEVGLLLLWVSTVVTLKTGVDYLRKVLLDLKEQE